MTSCHMPYLNNFSFAPTCPTPVESVKSSPAVSPRASPVDNGPSSVIGSPISEEKFVPPIYQHVLQESQPQICQNQIREIEIPKSVQIQTTKTPTKTKLKGKKKHILILS